MNRAHTWRSLRPTAEALAQRWGFDQIGTENESAVGRVVHELAHNLDLQINRAELLPTLALDIVLQTLGAERSDATEMRALAVQEVWFERHGLARAHGAAHMGRGYLLAARVALPIAEAARRYAATKSDPRTARIADRIDVWFGLAPRPRKARAVHVTDEQQLQIGWAA